MQDLNSSESRGSAQPLEHAVGDIVIAERMDTPTGRISYSEPSELFLWNDYPPFHNLPTQDELFSALVAAHPHVVTGQNEESTRQMPEAMVSTPNSCCEYPSGRFGTLVNDQICADGRPEHITYQTATLLSSEGAKSPFDQTLNLGTHTMPPSEHQRDQIIEAPELIGPHQIPKRRSAPGSKSGLTAAAKWHCHYGECVKKYRRLQELIRHIRDKHEIPRKCFLCDMEWTRAEKIRSHYITRHKDQFTNDEREKIKRLRRRNNTIRFFEEWQITRFHSSNMP